MGDQLDFYKLSYLWKACDHLMGFKEFVHIRRTVLLTWMEIECRDYVFDRKAIGSLGENVGYNSGTNDELAILNNTCVLSEESQWNPSLERISLLLAEYVEPGYCLLKYITGPVFSEDLYDAISDSGVYFSSSKVIRKFLDLTPTNARSEGPFIVVNGQRITGALPVLGWPRVAKEYIKRDRKRCWPGPETLDKIIRDGCHCVPVGAPESAAKHLEWQLCFSVAECTLVHSMDHSLFKLYQILKILIHEGLNNMDDCGKIVSSYIIKTLMFWMCEDKLPNFICAGNLKESIEECLTQLQEWIRDNFIPHYFIPERNLFERNFRPLEKAKVLERLSILKSDVLKELLMCPFFKAVETEVSAEPPESVDSLYVTSDDMKTRCEFVFFECIGDTFCNGIRWPEAIRILRNFENAFVYDSLCDLQLNTSKQMYFKVANAAGNIVYRVVKNSFSNKRKYELLHLSEEFLKIGCSADVTSGKLSLASLYFCLEKSKKCLNVTNAVLRDILPSTVYVRGFANMSNNSSRRNHYQELTSSEPISLSQKMKRYCVTDIEIIQSTSLWPAVIDLEIETFPRETRLIKMPALVYLYFLRFLCFEIQGDEILKMEALSELSAIAYDDEHNDGSFLAYDIIGICHERVGSYSQAVEMFGKASKEAKMLDWMNENINPGLLRIAIVLNKRFREMRQRNYL